MKTISRNAIIGYPAGIITGITYGLNPLFAVPLMRNGASIESILFFRYGFAVVILGLFLMFTKHSFKITAKQAGVLLALGLLYTSSSLLLFGSYNYIASGLATTLVFLYPVLVALIMVFLRVVPSWPVWLSIFATFGGVIIMTQNGASQSINPIGVIMSIASAFAYALFIVIINRSKAISSISNSLLTFYASLAVATRIIGATKASVLGVFEPITAILVGTIVFGEALTANIIIGITIATAAVTFMIALTKR